MLLKSVSVAYATGISSPHRATCRRFIRCGFILLCLYTSHLFCCDCLHHIYPIVFVDITFILLWLSTSLLFYCVYAHHIYSIVFGAHYLYFYFVCAHHIYSIVFVDITFILLWLSTSLLFYCVCAHHIYSILILFILFIEPIETSWEGTETDVLLVILNTPLIYSFLVYKPPSGQYTMAAHNIFSVSILQQIY